MVKYQLAMIIFEHRRVAHDARKALNEAEIINNRSKVVCNSKPFRFSYTGSGKNKQESHDSRLFFFFESEKSYTFFSVWKNKQLLNFYENRYENVYTALVTFNF